MSQQKKSSNDNINPLEEVFIKGQEYKNIIEKRKVWDKLAKTFKGTLKVTETVRQDIILFRLKIPYKGVELLLIETDTKPLKFEFHLILKFNSEFCIYWEDGFEKVFKLFGKQDVQLGLNAFDKKYMIQAKEEGLISDLLVHQNLYLSILNHNIYSISSDYEEDTMLHKFITVKDRNTEDIDVLKDLIHMQFHMIDFFIEKDLIQNSL